MCETNFFLFDSDIFEVGRTMDGEKMERRSVEARLLREVCLIINPLRSYHMDIDRCVQSQNFSEETLIVIGCVKEP